MVFLFGIFLSAVRPVTEKPFCKTNLNTELLPFPGIIIRLFKIS